MRGIYGAASDAADFIERFQIMKKHEVIRFAGALALAAFVLPTVGVAASHTGSGGTTTGFICPVFNSDSEVADHNPKAVEIGGGDYSIIGPSVTVATTATNDNGAGTPGGAHASPGDSTYTAIWKTN